MVLLTGAYWATAGLRRSYQEKNAEARDAKQEGKRRPEEDAREQNEMETNDPLWLPLKGDAVMT